MKSCLLKHPSKLLGASSVLLAVGLAGIAQAQLPSIGPAVPNVGPNVGPSVNPGVPSVRLPSVNPRLPSVNPRLPSANIGGAAGGAANAASRTAANVGSNVPLRIEQTGVASDLGMNLDTRSGRIRVAGISADTLSAAAGFQAGDEILAVNRNWVRNYNELASQLSAAAAGDGRAVLYITRGGTKQWINLDFAGASRGGLGVRVVEDRGTLRIHDVTAGSAAATAGLRANDRVISVNGVAVKSAGDLVAQVQGAAKIDGVVDVVVNRNGAEQTLRATVKQAGNAAGSATARGQDVAANAPPPSSSASAV